MRRPGVALLALIAACGGGTPGAPEAAPAASDGGTHDTSRTVQVQMRNVGFRVDSAVVLEISRLRGSLVPTSDTTPPTFDHPGSFTLTIASAEIAIDTASLSNLLSGYVFAYPGSPLGKLRVGIRGAQIVQTGVLKKGIHFPFSVVSNVTLTPEGLIRLHPTEINVVGIGAQGLMKFFGMNLQGLARIGPGHGVSIENNDFLLDPTGILPPPRVRGRVSSMALKDGKVIQVFGSRASADSNRVAAPDSAVRNYMYFKGATLRFGKLTMADADLFIVDEDPSDRFDFYLGKYMDQLTAGFSHTRRNGGLTVSMPDRHRLGARRSAVAGSGGAPEPARAPFQQ